ncbi:uncharacterized protein LOC115620462 [Scaptodrosophila lebanonensis]|uniref:Uncharacterized protein LOC115620462 n=1 Tax=Drosophila lebanonensis TaxID=7225 RepID=A0A6J2T2Q6_DROLE|nr:uncharacterized protein LOC115620462 [Scaptodrosophila lebanonensis]
MALPLYKHVLLCCVLIGIISGEKEHKFKLLKLEKSVEDTNDLQSDLHLEKDGEDEVTKISGEFKQLKEMDDEWKVHIVVSYAEKPDDKYEELAKFPSMGVCEVLGSYYKKHFYEKLKEYSNAPDPDTCPVTPETYRIKDYPFDASALTKYLQPGRYRIISKLIKDEQIKLEYIAHAKVE